jgi:hypothetical protein
MKIEMYLDTNFESHSVRRITRGHLDDAYGFIDYIKYIYKERTGKEYGTTIYVDQYGNSHTLSDCFR